MTVLYYAAYGSNLNKRQMLERCPASKPLEGTVLSGYRIVFKHVADIVKSPTHSVPIGIYIITKECEKALDHYEDFPVLYQKQYFTLDLEVGNVSVMIYIMNDLHGYGEPPQHYVDVITRGYNDWQFDKSGLDLAINFSTKHADGTHYHSKRWSKSP